MPNSPGRWLALLFGLAVLVSYVAGILTIPGALVAGAFMPAIVTILVAALFLGQAFADEAPGPNECPSCGYDLSGIDGGTCPECGWERRRESGFGPE